MLETRTLITVQVTGFSHRLAQITGFTHNCTGYRILETGIFIVLHRSQDA
jgi:hypothetical protein